MGYKNFSTASLDGQADFVCGFLETLSIDASTEADFNSGTESLDVGNSSDTRVVDFPLARQKNSGREIP